MNLLSRQATLVTALGSAQLLAWGSTYYLPAILAEPMAADLGVSTSIIFVAFSAALITAAILGPLAGQRIDLSGGRDVLAISSLVFAAGLALLGVAQGAVVLIIAWLVIGVGMAMGLYEAAFATLAGILGREARSAITGITLLAGFASTVCWPMTAYLQVEIGWRATCFVWAAAHIFIGLPLNRLFVPLAKRPIEGRTTHEPTKSARQAASGLCNRTALLLAFVFAVSWFISTAMAAHLPRLLEDAGATPMTAVTAAALVGPAQVAARLLEFGVLRRFHSLLSARLAAIAHPLGATAVLGLGAPAAVTFALLHGAGNGVLTIAKGTLPLAIFGPVGYGLRQGVLMVPARFGQAGAPFLFGLLMERYGSSALFLSIALGCACFAALLALAPSTTAEQA